MINKNGFAVKKSNERNQRAQGKSKVPVRRDGGGGGGYGGGDDGSAEDDVGGEDSGKPEPFEILMANEDPVVAMISTKEGVSFAVGLVEFFAHQNKKSTWLLSRR